MSPDVLNNLPNAVALLVLTGILVLLLRRQPQLAVGSWIAALVITLLVECLWFLTIPNTDTVHIVVHTISLVGSLSTGVAFLLFNGKQRRIEKRRAQMILLNAIPLLAVALLYGLNVYRPRPYYICAAVAAALGTVTWFRFRASRIYSLLQLANSVSIAYFAHAGQYRIVTYWTLGTVFLSAAINSWRRLHKSSIGRVAFVLALTLWAASLYVHPWTVQSTVYEPVAVHVWEMQKFFAIIGILIILLESEIRENQRLAMHDQLTGLPNRGFMEKALLEAMDEGPCAVILLDLNGFKQFNDTLGHLAGDELLRQFSMNIRGRLGPRDTLARVGGDEFIIVTHDFTLAEALEAAVPVTVRIGQEEHEVFAGIGTAAHPLDSTGAAGYAAIKQLILLADNRMYKHKAASKLRAEAPVVSV